MTETEGQGIRRSLHPFVFAGALKGRNELKKEMLL